MGRIQPQEPESPANKHDYRERKDKPGVLLIVRPNVRYGAAVEGEIVLVDETELQNGSTRRSCMTPEEALELDRRREEARKALEALKNKKSQVVSMVEAGLAQLMNSVKANKEQATADVLEHDRRETIRQAQAAIEAAEASAPRSK